jgi:uncharacterized protein (TIGR03435 family)
MRAVAILALVAGAAALAQTPPRPTFEAAAIHLVRDCGSQSNSRSDPSSGRLSVPCISIRGLIRTAYGIFESDGTITARRLDVVGGPAWLDSELYEIDAKADGATSLDRLAGLMLQTLLEERCKLKVHREPRQTPVYALTVAKGGSKLKESTPESCVPLDLSHPIEARGYTPCGFPSNMRGDGRTITVEAKGVTMPEFAARVITRIDRPIVDRTGLTGRYDIRLSYAPENAATIRLNGEAASGGVLPQNADGESIFSAVQSQLGLRLTPEKAPIDVIVVDSVERPSEN